LQLIRSAAWVALKNVVESRFPGFTLEEILRKPGNAKCVEATITSTLDAIPEFKDLCGRAELLRYLKRAAEQTAKATESARVPESSEEGGL
jgi:hypothetical protein